MGTNNTLVGTSLGNAMTNAYGNTFVGSAVGTGVTGSANTMIGFAIGGGITSGAKNTLIGCSVSNLSNLSNNIIIADGDGNRRFNSDASGNIGLNGFGQYGGGAGVIYISNATTAPTSNPVGGGILYVDNGALKYRGSGWNSDDTRSRMIRAAHSMMFRRRPVWPPSPEMQWRHV